jgi:redox-regulated HSP33 family molecular chaperone
MRFGEEERVEMRGSDGLVSVDCEFCARRFRFDL